MIPIRTTTESLTTRPGRVLRQYRDADINVFTNYGDDIHNKAEGTVRIYFQNVKGLTHSESGEDYEYYLSNLKLIQVDIAGLAETNTPWQLQHIKTDFLQQSKKHFQISKTVFGAIGQSIDPLKTNENWQAGGCLTIVQGQWTTTIHREDICDPKELGRWAGITLTGSKDRAVSIISAYRSCKGSIATSGINSTFHREYEFHR